MNVLLLWSLALTASVGGQETASMTLNSVSYPNGSEVGLAAGSAFTLRCRGNGSTAVWATSAFQLRSRDDLGDTVTVRRSEPRHTGTYRCGALWIHLYVRDVQQPSQVFVVARRIPTAEEGRDFLLECLLTDPSVTKMALRWETGGLPLGMAVTLDPKRGALIRNLSLAYRGRYVCSAQRDGQELTSTQVILMVAPRRVLPLVAVSQEFVIRVIGESLEMTCQSTSPEHSLSVTWTHTHLQDLRSEVRQRYEAGCLRLNSTLTLTSVSRRHGGRYTCAATNQAGVANATAWLTVVDAPYLRVYLLPGPHANSNANANVSTNGNTNASSAQMDARLVVDASTNGSLRSGGANGSTLAEASVVEVWEWTDVVLSCLTEAYPPLHHHRWDAPQRSNASTHQESFSSQPDRVTSSLLLRRVRFQDQGKYRFSFSSGLLSGHHTLDLRVYRAPDTRIQPSGNQTLRCSSSGYPRPTLYWFICPGVAESSCRGNVPYQVLEADQPGQSEEWDEEVHTELALSSSDDIMTVECVARSKVGVSRDLYVSYPRSDGVKQEGPGFSNFILIGSCSIALLLLLLLLAVLYKYKQKPRYELRWKIIDCNQGNHYSFIDPNQLPYNHLEWEFPREQLQLGLVVGAGAFGKVLEATAYGLGDEHSITRVAVKMLKPSAHSEERDALMSELKILSHLGYHDNIVNLLGACTQGGPMLMITEYCYHGDLLNFLRGQASILDADNTSTGYKNMEDSFRFRSDSGISCSEYQEMQPMLLCDDPLNPRGVCLGDLLHFSHQVALGMDFLSSRNCIHRDVAARNVLLTESRVAKICDFGLARDITDDDNYIIKGNARLPVKWMSPESIFQCVYTSQSDVWSYGVLLWEVFSLGQSPYPNVVVDAHFYKMIKAGHHMSQPDFAPIEIYQLMIGCWNLEPTHRPTFPEIGQLMKNLLPREDAHTQQGETPSERTSQQGAPPGQRLKSESEDDPRQEISEPRVRMKMMKNVYH